MSFLIPTHQPVGKRFSFPSVILLLFLLRVKGNSFGGSSLGFILIFNYFSISQGSSLLRGVDEG